jgi:NAD(P)-dependent dehydrogenase (short-subunit alcohol dehydrogenase family)
MKIDWTTNDIPLLQGQRYLITGANSGIGYRTALELARRGGVVVMACRDRTRGEEALARLRREAVGPDSAASAAELVQLDLASLESVRAMAEAELARGKGLHCLINNAGVMAPKKRRETRDGFELQFGTNVLAHFALTCRLLPSLERNRAARVEDAPRVVTIASIAHKRGRLAFEDLNSTRRYVPMAAYAQSKLADLMLSFELERRLRAARMGTISLAAHPGVANTRLFQSGEYPAFEREMRKIVGVAIGAFLNSDAEGALPTLYAATGESATGGGYYGPQGLLEMRGGDVGNASVAARALDLAAQKKLWEACETMTGVTLP